jgi:hypothetical protein
MRRYFGDFYSNGVVRKNFNCVVGVKEGVIIGWVGFKYTSIVVV